MNYGDLKALVAATSHRGDLTTQIPSFISSAETLIANSVKAREMSAGVTLSDADRPVPGGSGFKLPDRFMELRYMYVNAPDSGDARKLLNATILDIFQTKEIKLEGTPTIYQMGVRGATFTVAPIPPLGTTIGVIYWKQADILVNDTDEPPLLEFQPDLYLYGALIYLAIFVQDMELHQFYLDLFGKTVDSVNAQALRSLDEAPITVRGASSWH